MNPRLAFFVPTGIALAGGLALGALAVQEPAAERCAEIERGSRCSVGFPPTHGTEQWIRNKRTDTAVKVTFMVGGSQHVRKVAAGGREYVRCSSPTVRIVGCAPVCP